MNFCHTNPPNTERGNQRVTISQEPHSKSESTYGIEQIKLTLGLTPGKSLHPVLEVFSVLFLPYLNTAVIFLVLNGLQTLFGDCLVSAVTIKNYNLNLVDLTTLSDASRKYMKCEYFPKMFFFIYESSVSLKTHVNFRCAHS